jgi:hypothetical protein
MADNTQVTNGTGDVVRDKDRSGVKTQVVGLDVGIGTGTEALMSSTSPAPVGNTVQTSASFSASDAVVGAPAGTGALMSGASTAGSVIALAVPSGMSAWTMLIKSYATGTIYSEASTNSTNGTDGDWIEVKGRLTGQAPGLETITYAYTANGYYRGNDGGFTYLRARLIGTGTPSVQITASTGTGAVFLNSSLPGGSNNIGTVYNRVSSLTLTTGNITTAASTVTATTDISNAGAVTAVVAGTYAGVNLSFEASLEGTNWVGVIGQRTDSYVTETTSGVLTANTIRAWDFPLPGFTQFRVRSTAWTSGTAVIGIAPAVNAFEIAPNVGLAGVGIATESGVAASASSGTLLAANPARRGATISNDATSATLYARLSSSAAANSSGNYTVVIPPGGYYEVPFNYTGQITGIWTSAVGFANVTELT